MSTGVHAHFEGTLLACCGSARRNGAPRPLKGGTESVREESRRLVVIRMRTTARLRDNSVDHSQLEAVASIGVEGRRGLLRLVDVTPEDRRATSGEITEYMAFSCMRTRSASAIATAPPDPPSPMMHATDGTPRRAITAWERAIQLLDRAAQRRRQDRPSGCR